jgi:hypothetical protein
MEIMRVVAGMPRALSARPVPQCSIKGLSDARRAVRRQVMRVAVEKLPSGKRRAGFRIA